MINLILKDVLQVWEKDFDIPKRLDIEVTADGHGLTLRTEEVKEILEMLEKDEQVEISIYLDKDQLTTVFDALAATNTFRARPYFVWPLSLKFQLPGIRFEIE